MVGDWLERCELLKKRTLTLLININLVKVLKVYPL